MKTSKLSMVILFGLCLVKPIEAGNPEQFNLTMGSLVPMAGNETERTISFFQETWATNYDGRTSVTNISDGMDAKFRDKVLVWDTTSDYAKVEVTMDHFSIIHQGKTNELFTGGTRLIGTYLLGGWFFYAPDEHVRDAYEQKLKYLFPHHPATGLSQYDRLQLDQPRSAGESWKLSGPIDTRLLNALGNSQDNPFSRFLLQELKTNDINSTAQFIKTTNLFGVNCFHLRTITDIHESLKRLRFSMADRGDYLAPFNSTLKSWINNNSTEAYMVVLEPKNGTIITHVGVKFLWTFAERCRDVSQK
jgi:hypothetical protein